MKTEKVLLPSKGLLYPEGHPYANGEVELRYMTAKDEDILSSEKFIKEGKVVDELLKSLLVDNSGYDDLLVGDKNSIMFVARILGFGPEYNIKLGTKDLNINLEQLEPKEIDETLYQRGKNEFTFDTPIGGDKIHFKLLDHKTEQNLNKDIEGLKKLYPDNVPVLATTLKNIIVAVNGDKDKQVISKFVDESLITRDSMALRKHIKAITPDIDLNYKLEDGREIQVPITLEFFYPKM